VEVEEVKEIKVVESEEVVERSVQKYLLEVGTIM